MTTRTTEPMPGRDDYRTSIDALRFSDEAKARMAARLADAATRGRPAEASPKAARRRHLPLAAAVAAVGITLTLGGVAYATGSLVSVERFVSRLFGAGEPTVEVVDKVGRPVGVAQSSNGVTVSADAIIGDKTNVAVIFSISKDDGSSFEGVEATDDDLLPLGLSDDVEVDFPLVTQITQGYGATGSAYFYDADPADNAIQLVETRSYDGLGDATLVGRTMTVHLADLKLYGKGEPTMLAEGAWDLSFPLSYEDASVALPTGQAFRLAAFVEDDEAETREQVDGIDATIDELSVSPIALHLRYTARQQVSWTSGESGRQSEHDSQLSDTLLTVPVTLTCTDGSAIELSSNGGGAISAGEEVAHCETSIFFDRILDLDEVAGITIGGTTIEL